MMTFHGKILTSLLGFLPVSLALSCPAGFEISSRSTCLKLVYRGNGFESVMDASDACRGLGTYMARMLTINDNSLMQNMLENAKLFHNLNEIYAFLGGSDIAVEGSFVWTNGMSVEQSFWSGREPNNWQGLGGEDCIVLLENGKMNDVPCCSTSWGSVTSVICEYNPASPIGQSANDDLFYEKCRTGSSTIHIQTSSEYSASPDFSALSYSANISRESNTRTDVLTNMSVSPSPEFPSGEFNTSEQEGNTMLKMTEYSSSSLVVGSSIMEESPNPTSGLDTTDTAFPSASHIIGNMYSSEWFEFPSDSGQNIRSTGNAGSEPYGSGNVVKPTSLLYLETSPDLISITAGPENSSEFISITPTQMAKVTEINQYVSYTLSSVNVSHRAVPLIPRPRRRCSNKNQTQYQTDFKINMLKVERNETQKFKRKFSCAHDNRKSSFIIGVVSCILLLVSYLFIVITDSLTIQSIKCSRPVNRKKNCTHN